MVAQMQGRLGRLHQSSRRNRKPVNYFRGEQSKSMLPRDLSPQVVIEEAASGNVKLKPQAVGDRQGSGAAVWSALKVGHGTERVDEAAR